MALLLKVIHTHFLTLQLLQQWHKQWLIDTPCQRLAWSILNLMLLGFQAYGQIYCNPILEIDARF